MKTDIVGSTNIHYTMLYAFLQQKKNKTNIHYANNHYEQDTSLIKQLKSTEIAIREQPWQDTSVFIFCF